MKKSIRYLTFLILIIGMLFTSCVSSKKFMASEARADKLQKENSNTLNKLNESNMQTMKIKEEKALLQKEKDAIQKEFDSVQNDLMLLSSETNMTIREQAIRLKSLQDIIDSQSEITNRLKTSIAKALMNYKADELTVYLKDGNVYVSLAEKLLFKSGSDLIPSSVKPYNS